MSQEDIDAVTDVAMSAVETVAGHWREIGKGNPIRNYPLADLFAQIPQTPSAQFASAADNGGMAAC